MVKLRQRLRPAGPRSPGFSLLELIGVMVVMALLVSLLLPALQGVRQSSLKARSRAQFAQWILAVEGFRQEYGYYPFLEGEGDTAFAINAEGNRTAFLAVLGGRDVTLNPRGIVFYQPDETQLLDPDADDSPLCDAFQNTRLLLLLDGDGDGRIRVDGHDVRSPVAVVALPDARAGYPEVRTWNP